MSGASSCKYSINRTWLWGDCTTSRHDGNACTSNQYHCLYHHLKFWKQYKHLFAQGSKRRHGGGGRRPVPVRGLRTCGLPLAGQWWGSECSLLAIRSSNVDQGRQQVAPGRHASGCPKKAICSPTAWKPITPITHKKLASAMESCMGRPTRGRLAAC